MWLARQVNGGSLQSWRVDPLCIHGHEIRRRAPRAWQFGQPARPGAPMLAQPGIAAVGESYAEALDLLARINWRASP